jgi:hypothetical protein
MRQVISFFVLWFVGYNAYGQLGGTRSFAFLSLDPTARMASLGSNYISVKDKDPGVGYLNPAMLNKDMNQTLALNYSNYLADINNGFASYVKHYDSLGTFSGSIMYINYGKFEETDVTGQITGSFTASDYNFQVGWGREYKDFTYGANVKFLYSVYEKYVATAGAIDLGGAWHRPKKKLTATLLLKNIGYNFIPYQDVREKVPFEIQAGISKKLEHNPLQFSIVMHDIQKWDLGYVNPNKRYKKSDLETGQEQLDEVGFGDNLLRHFIFGAELVFSENFQVRFGYNHQRRKELAPENRQLMTGFSWGVGMGIKRFMIAYGNSSYFPGISAHYFSVSKNLSDFKRKKIARPGTPQF